MLAGLDDQAIPLFEEAIERKRNEFGHDHAEVAVSLDELGIQYFARSMFDESLKAFEEARRIRVKEVGGSSHHPKVAMVLNNIACCKFQMKKHDEAIHTLQEARDILTDATGMSVTADLDLLHVAITHCNYAYLLVRAKKYEEARSIFEEALLVSVCCSVSVYATFYKSMMFPKFCNPITAFLDPAICTGRQSSSHSRHT